MKNLFTFILLLSFAFMVPKTIAQEANTKKMKSTEQNDGETKNRRRKKVMMCHECGKPEVECECEGEGHGVKEGDSSDHQEDSDA
tara:strand:- start:3937 stop:4191 length:255 start_codon:yes stop_codon:yes gene_type:complete